jgi:hypothetical protein
VALLPLLLVLAPGVVLVYLPVQAFLLLVPLWKGGGGVLLFEGLLFVCGELHTQRERQTHTWSTTAQRYTVTLET